MSIIVAAIWLVGLVVHIEVITIIQYMPIAECKDVTPVVVVILPWIGFVGYMDGIAWFCWGGVAGSGSAVYCRGIRYGGHENTEAG